MISLQILENKRLVNYNGSLQTLAIKLPFNANLDQSNSPIFNMSVTTEEQSISNFINLLFTRPGERYLQPELGVGLDLYLFEQFTEILETNIIDRITSQSNKWLPYIQINNIRIEEDQNHRIFININFKVNEFGANREITFRLSDVDNIQTIIAEVN